MNEVRELRRRAAMTQAALAVAAGVPQSNIAAYESGKRQPSETTLKRIRAAARPRPSVVLAEHKAEVLDLVRKHKADNPRVFGSVARGDDHSGSDVDLLVRFERDASLYDLVELQEDLRDLLGVEVDVVSEAGLKPGSEKIVHESLTLR